MRPYHSASSTLLGGRCPRAWSYHYLAGLVEPELAWPDIEAGRVEANSRQRALSFGKAGHAVGQDWYTPGAQPDWASMPGLAFAAGAHLLPQPDLCTRVEAEAAIGDEPSRLDDGPPLIMRLHAVRWAGFRDLLAWPTEAEATRLGLVPGEPVLVDYKFTSDPDRWAKTAAELTADLAANLYAIDSIRRWWRLEPVPPMVYRSIQCRWVYFASKKPWRALPVDFRIDFDEAFASIEPHAVVARSLDAVVSVEAASANPAACLDYVMPRRRKGEPPEWQGGCQYHVTNGGPCQTVRPALAFIQLMTRLERPKMGLAKSFAQQPLPPVTPPAGTPPAQPPFGSAQPPPQTVPAAAQQTTRPSQTPATGKRKSRGKSKETTVAPIATGDLAALQQRKADAEAKIEAAAAAHAAAVAELDAVRGEITTARDALTGLLGG